MTSQLASSSARTHSLFSTVSSWQIASRIAWVLNRCTRNPGSRSAQMWHRGGISCLLTRTSAYGELTHQISITLDRHERMNATLSTPSMRTRRRWATDPLIRTPLTYCIQRLTTFCDCLAGSVAYNNCKFRLPESLQWVHPLSRCCGAFSLPQSVPCPGIDKSSCCFWQAAIL